jgi:uridine phosphorylase
MKATELNTGRIPESQLILNDDQSVYHLGITGAHVADTVIIVGDPERVTTLSQRFDQVIYRQASREFVIHTGRLGTREITVLSTGIGVDNIDIVINELDAAVNIDPSTRQVREQLRSLNLIRIGTCGALQEDIEVGALIASAFAIGYDGVPWHYKGAFEPEEKALADAFTHHARWPEELSKPYCAKASSVLLEQFGGNAINGITLTANGFYGPQNRSLRLRLSDDERLERIRTFAHEGMVVTNFEMECAGIYALSSMLGHRALTLCVALANRYREAFSKDPKKDVNTLIDKVLSQL